MFALSLKSRETWTNSCRPSGVVKPGSMPFDSIGFGMKSLIDRGIPAGTPVDLAFMPEFNHWNGYDRIQLRIRDLRVSDRGTA